MKKLLLVGILVATSTITHAQLFNINPQESATSQTVNAAVSADVSAFVQYFADTQDLQGNFTQTVHGQRGLEQSQGKMWISKPGKFYWDYQGANAQKIISNGSKVWQYDIDLEQISVRGRDELVGDVAMNILSGTREIQELFAINAVAQPQLPVALQALAKDGQSYRLTPLSEQDGYDAVWVVMKNNQLAALAVDAGRGQQTVIEFSQLQRNVGIAAGQFEFTPPAGVDVIGE